MKSVGILVHPSELSKKWIDRCENLGVDTIAIHPGGGKTANESLQIMLDKLQNPSFTSLIDYALEKGLRFEYEMHAMRFLLPATEFDAHPEWFRQNANGERTTDYNLCPSNSEAVDYVAKKTVSLAKKLYKSSSRYYFWLDDARDCYCHCEKCKSLSPSDQQTIVLNAMIGKLKEYDENATLSYLAYMDTLPPPSIDAHPSLFLEYAPFKRDFDVPLRISCERNAHETEHLDALIKKFGTSSARALDYWLDNSLYSNWKKPPKEFEMHPKS